MTGPANSLDANLNPLYLKALFGLQLIDHFDNKWAFKLNHLAALAAHYMLMLKGFFDFITPTRISQPVFIYQTQFFKERQAAIDSRKADGGIFFTYDLIQITGINRFRALFDDRQNQLPLGRRNVLSGPRWIVAIANHSHIFTILSFRQFVNSRF
jgi:hypothetical protein